MTGIIIVVCKHPGGFIKCLQSITRSAYPKNFFAVFKDCTNPVISNTPGVFWIMKVTFESTRFAVKPVQSARSSLSIFIKRASRTYPYNAFMIFINGAHQVIAKTGGIICNMGKMCEVACLWIEAVKTSISSYPQSPLLILHQSSYGIITEAASIVCQVAEMCNNACSRI